MDSPDATSHANVVQQCPCNREMSTSCTSPHCGVSWPAFATQSATKIVCRPRRYFVFLALDLVGIVHGEEVEKPLQSGEVPATGSLSCGDHYVPLPSNCRIKRHSCEGQITEAVYGRHEKQKARRSAASKARPTRLSPQTPADSRALRTSKNV